MTEKLGTCSKCDLRWGGDQAAHCPSCCRQFASTWAFDLHLGRIPESGPPPCRDPAKLRKRDGTPKLVCYDGVWAKPHPAPDGSARGAEADSPGRTPVGASPDTSVRRACVCGASETFAGDPETVDALTLAFDRDHDGPGHGPSMRPPSEDGRVPRRERR